jgi:hypothetical protein
MKKYAPILLISLLLFFAVGRVLAHTELRSAVPAPGASLIEQPEEIRLTFSEAVGPGSIVTLFGERFREIEGLETSVDPDTPEQLVTAVPQLEPGTYSVQWVALSLDGHPASGSYSFAVLEEAQTADSSGIWFWLLLVIAFLGLVFSALRGTRNKSTD